MPAGSETHMIIAELPSSNTFAPCLATGRVPAKPAGIVVKFYLALS